MTTNIEDFRKQLKASVEAEGGTLHEMMIETTTEPDKDEGYVIEGKSPGDLRMMGLMLAVQAFHIERVDDAIRAAKLIHDYLRRGKMPKEPT